FPQPDSPTTPTVCPFATVRLASVNAYTFSCPKIRADRIRCTTLTFSSSSTCQLLCREVTRHHVPLVTLVAGRLGPADRLGGRTAVSEPAPRREVRRRRHGTGDLGEPGVVGFERQDGAEQAARVVVPRMADDLGGRPGLGDLAAVHDNDPIGD